MTCIRLNLKQDSSGKVMAVRPEMARTLSSVEAKMACLPYPGPSFCKATTKTWHCGFSSLHELLNDSWWSNLRHSKQKKVLLFADTWTCAHDLFIIRTTQGMTSWDGTGFSHVPIFRAEHVTSELLRSNWRIGWHQVGGLRRQLRQTGWNSGSLHRLGRSTFSAKLYVIDESSNSRLRLNVATVERFKALAMVFQVPYAV